MTPITDYENVCRLQERIFLRIEEGTILISDILDALKYIDELSKEYMKYNRIILKDYKDINDIKLLINIFNFNSIGLLNGIFLVLKGEFEF